MRQTVSFESLEQTRFEPTEATAYAAYAVHAVAIAVGSATIEVRFSQDSAATAFAERFGNMLCDRRPVATVHAVACEGVAYFWLATERVWCWPHDLDDELCVFFADNVALHEYLRSSDDVGFHAAAIGRGPHVAALVGRSTAGKTTTAIATVANGFSLYSDERCILQNGRVVPFLRAMTVRAGGRAALLRCAPASRGLTSDALNARLGALPASGDFVIRPRDLLGDRAGGPPARLRWVLIITGRAATPSLQACSVYDVMPALLSSMISRESGIERMARLLSELRTTLFFRLRLGTPAATATAIERTLALP